MAITLNGSTGIDAPALTLDTPLADAEGGTGQVTAVPFKLQFTSAEQTITSGGTLTLPHGLGSIPSLIQLRLVCKTTDQGYAVNDELLVPAYNDDGTVGRGVSLVADATNINIKYTANANAFVLLNKSTGVRGSTTNANWKLVVRAWA